MPYEIAVNVRYLPDMMAGYEAQGKTGDEAADMVLAGQSLSGDKLERLIKALNAYRAKLLEQRVALDLPTHTLFPGDSMPPIDTLDGKLFRVGTLLARLQRTYNDREESSGRSENVLVVSGQLRPGD